jgi:hypothetical protein
MTTAALALAGLAWTAPAATAATGDLILSFRFSDNTNTNDLEVDLGQQSLFTTTATLNLTYGANYYAGSNAGGLSSSDLDAVFGTTGGAWNTLSLLSWDVSGHTGTTSSNTHLFATQPTTGGITAAAVGASLTNPGGRLQTLSNGFQGTASAVSLTSPAGWAVPISPATQSEYTGALRNASPTVSNDFGFFTVSTETGVSSSGNVSMELYNYGPSTRTDLGTFTLTPSGNFTFTGIAAVPEPSTLTALAGGLGLLGFFRRRRATA